MSYVHSKEGGELKSICVIRIIKIENGKIKNDVKKDYYFNFFHLIMNLEEIAEVL